VINRITLDETSWVEYVTGWLPGPDADELLAKPTANAAWGQRERRMGVNRVVIEPRLTAEYNDRSPSPETHAVDQRIRRSRLRPGRRRPQCVRAQRAWKATDGSKQQPRTGPVGAVTLTASSSTHLLNPSGCYAARPESWTSRATTQSQPRTRSAMVTVMPPTGSSVPSPTPSKPGTTTSAAKRTLMSSVSSSRSGS
jgi:hypothetical protein